MWTTLCASDGNTPGVRGFGAEHRRPAGGRRSSPTCRCVTTPGAGGARSSSSGTAPAGPAVGRNAPRAHPQPAPAPAAAPTPPAAPPWSPRSSLDGTGPRPPILRPRAKSLSPPAGPSLPRPAIGQTTHNGGGRTWIDWAHLRRNCRVPAAPRPAPDDAWTLPTPCPDWDIRYLVAHVIGGNRFATLILDGMPAPDAIDQVMSAPQLGHDAMAAWASA